MVDETGTHPVLQPECAKLFKDGTVNESACKALEKYEVYVQKKTGSRNIWNNLMAEAFNENSPKIQIADIANKRGKALQEGFIGGLSRFCVSGNNQPFNLERKTDHANYT